MYLDDQRILLQARPAPRRAPQLEVVMLGHCGGDADLGQLRPGMIAGIRELGLTATAGRLGAATSKTGTTRVDVGDDLVRLYHVPIPLLSLADFQVLFPGAQQPDDHSYTSRLAGNRYWLPRAVEDFFAGYGRSATGILKLWVIRIPERDGQEGFLPWRTGRPDAPESLHGIGRALLIPEAGLIAMPDLERLQVPAALTGRPGLKVPVSPPRFLPVCDSPSGDNDPQPAPRQAEPWPLDRILTRIVQPLERYRPDMQCLWTMPLAYRQGTRRPGLSEAALQALDRVKGSPTVARGLHRIQLLYPYLSDREWPLFSATGRLAGRIALQAAQRGAWRSVAGQDLGRDAVPYPPVEQVQATRWREGPGIGVLLRRGGRLYLDDERLASPYTPKYGQMLRDDSAQRSGELVRFMGFLQRRLQRLGEQLIFTIDPGDARPGLLLRQFFGRLHSAGALRGRFPDEAFRIRRAAAPAHVLSYEIELAPALPVDRVRISFSHREGANSWQVKP